MGHAFWLRTAKEEDGVGREGGVGARVGVERNQVRGCWRGGRGDRSCRGLGLLGCVLRGRGGGGGWRGGGRL